MDLMETILGQLSGGDTMKQLGKTLGTDEGTTGSATAATVASLLGALAKNSSDRGGAEALSDALARDHDGGLLDDVQGYLGQGRAGEGDGILKHVLGTKRPALERGIGKSTGMDDRSVSQLMTTLAPLVLAALGRAQRQKGLGASELAGLLGQEKRSIQERQPQAMDALAGFLDTDGDGDVDFGDITRRGMGLLGKFLSK